MKLDSFLAFTRYGNRFTASRKMIRQPLSVHRASSFYPVHRKETLILLRNMIIEPMSYEGHIDRYAGLANKVAAMD